MISSLIDYEMLGQAATKVAEERRRGREPIERIKEDTENVLVFFGAKMESLI